MSFSDRWWKRAALKSRIANNGLVLGLGGRMGDPGGVVGADAKYIMIKLIGDAISRPVATSIVVLKLSPSAAI